MRILCLIFFFVFSLLFFHLQAQPDGHLSFQHDSLLSVELNKKGRDAFRIGDFEESINYFTESLKIGRRIYGNVDLRIFSRLLNMGIPYKNLGEYDKAIDCYLEAEKIIIDKFSENHPRLGYVYANLGTVYKLQGDYVKNYEFQLASLRVLEGDSVRFKSQIVNAKYNIADALFLLKEYDQAIARCKRDINHVSNEAKSFYYTLLARIYSVQDKPELANEFYQKAFLLLKKLKGANNFELGLEYANYASFLLSSGQFENALTYNKLSESIIEKYFTKKSLQYSDVMLNFAEYYFLRGYNVSGIKEFNLKRKDDLLKSLTYYQHAIIAATEGFSSLDIYENPELSEAISEIQLLEIMKKKALCFEELADLNMSVVNTDVALINYEAALKSVTLATELVHQLRTGYVSEDSRFFLAENQEATFIDAVSISYKLYSLTGDQQYAEKGFEFAEKSKSASFLAAVRDSKAKEFGGIPDSLLKREDYFKINISNYREMLFEENQNDKPDSARLALYNSKIFQLNEQHQQLIELFEDSFPNYYSFKYENKVVDIQEVKSSVSEKDALVEFLIEEPSLENENGQVFRFVITRDEVHFTANPVDYSFVQDIEYLYGFLSNSNYLYTGLDEYKGYVKSAYNLFSVLLMPESDLLEGKELIIVPDDKLSYIPFDAMLSAMPDTSRMNFRRLPYLLQDYSISYTYSATLLFDYFENERSASKELLAFAPAYLGVGSDVDRNTLMPLPAVDQEIKSIEGFVTADVYRDTLAQEGEFKRLAPEFDILHMAMHTIINDTLPMYSKLAFSSPGVADLDDGWLNTGEIYTMDLKARMAVLSACNTGSGKLQKGEGVMSLARGFLYAGCPSIVMTLWEVEDESGALIMSDFYRLLSKGKSKNDALRLAKLSHIENADPLKAHPHYWLGYVAVGNTDPLYLSKDIYFILVILGLLVLLLVDQAYRKNKARRKPGF